MTVVAGNFGFAMNGTHYFVAFRFLADEDPVEVSAWFSEAAVPNPRGAQFSDRAGSIRAVTASGKRLYMEVGADQGHGVQVTYACRNGMMTVNELTGELILSERETQYRDLPTTRYGMPAVNSRRTIQPAELIDTSAAVLRALLRDENSVSGEDGRRAVELLVAAYQSAEHGNLPVRLDNKLDRARKFPWA
jgi:predicted dehydrogenase